MTSSSADFGHLRRCAEGRYFQYVSYRGVAQRLIQNVVHFHLILNGLLFNAYFYWTWLID